MKTIMKYAVCIILFSIWMTAAKGQEQKITLAFGPSLAKPVGTLHANLNAGLGGTIRLLFNVDSTFAFGMAPSYLFFGGKRDKEQDGYTLHEKLHAHLQLFTLAGSACLHFHPRVAFGMEVGVGFFSSDSSHTRSTTTIPGGSLGIQTASFGGDKGQGLFLSPFLVYEWRHLHFVLDYRFVKNAYAKTLLTTGVKDLSALGLSVLYRLNW